MSTQPKEGKELKPHDLDNELSEYASLIRALRTGHTLDLTTHILEYLHGDARAMGELHSRDQWTRWPLPDAAPSEWKLEDEIAVIIRHQFVKKRGGVEKDVNLDDSEERYVGHLVRYLTPILVNFLERILVIVEDHTFPRSSSMQNRINPLNWSDLANILASPAAGNLVDGR